MQGLIRDHGIILMRGTPFIEIRLHKVQVAGNPVLQGGAPPSFQHVGVQIETVDDEIVEPGGAQMQPKVHLNIAIPRANTDEALRIVFPRLALLHQVFPEHADRTAETERFELRPHVPVRPVVKNVGQAVYFQTIPIDTRFRGKTRSVRGCVPSGWIVVRWILHPLQHPPVRTDAQTRQLRRRAVSWQFSCPAWSSLRISSIWPLVFESACRVGQARFVHSFISTSWS